MCDRDYQQTYLAKLSVQFLVPWIGDGYLLRGCGPCVSVVVCRPVFLRMLGHGVVIWWMSNISMIRAAGHF